MFCVGHEPKAGLLTDIDWMQFGGKRLSILKINARSLNVSDFEQTIRVHIRSMALTFFQQGVRRVDFCVHGPGTETYEQTSWHSNWHSSGPAGTRIARVGAELQRSPA